MASPASPPEYLKLAIETLRVGSIGTENTLEIAHRYGACYLHASTSECYGDPLEHPQTESYWGNVNPVGPRSVYDEAKRYAESLTMAYHRYRGVNTHLVRIFNTYGPRLHPSDGRVISNFMMQALRGEPLTVYGDGQQTRSFCFVSDLIDGIVRLSRSEEHLPVNIGNPVEFTILECAQAVLEVTDSKSELLFKPLPQDDPTRRKPDISKAKAILDWEPKIGLREGLEAVAGFLPVEGLADFSPWMTRFGSRKQERKATGGRGCAIFVRIMHIPDWLAEFRMRWNAAFRPFLWRFCAFFFS